MRIDRRSFFRRTAVAGVSAQILHTVRSLVVEGAQPLAPTVAGDAADQRRIWDLHCHFSGVEGSTPQERAEQLLNYADRMGIERLVFFMGFPWSMDPPPAEFRRQNEQVLAILERWPRRLLGFAYVNGNYPEESIREIDRCVQNGPMVGIKLWVARRCSDAELDPIIRRCAQLQGAIYQHTWLKTQGNDRGESMPTDLAALAARHPKTPIICGHTGGDWPQGIRAVRAFENVSVGIGGSEPTSGFVEMAVRELGARRVIYGSDIGGRSIASQLAKVEGAEISEADKRLILGENLRRMLQPIMKAKVIEA
jgi:predicted TIM-barrel fold metal-dependent hydrolase